ncbi:MAG: hypothetical protein IIV08_07300, partial [Selenomonadales bacterium]|nr:hypothetical protein [Selenomonadales bacterium]
GIDKTDEIIESFGELGKAKIHRLTIPELEISATDIRQRVAEGRSIRSISDIWRRPKRCVWNMDWIRSFLSRQPILRINKM